MGKILITVGTIIVCVGILYTYFPSTVKWFGHLPGDIKVDKPNMKFYFPITSMVVVSILINLIVKVIKYVN